MIKHLLRVLLAGAAVAVSLGVSAQEFPSRPVKIVVPQTPGGASDALARIVGQKLSEKWQQPVVVENRPGAGGNVGMEFVAQAPADGYTLLMSYVGSHAINAALYKKLPFDPERDFAPVATLATLPFVLVARPDAPFKTVRELADLGRRQPLTFGSAGNGSVNHLLGVMFNMNTGTQLTHVPYKGAAPALVDVIGGHVDCYFSGLTPVAQHIKSGAVRLLALSSGQRSSLFPDTPTVAELMVPGFDFTLWGGLFAVTKTPPEIVRLINTEANQAYARPDFQARIQREQSDVIRNTPEQFSAYIKSQSEKYRQIIKDIGYTG